MARVYLVGAGPGATDLITVRAAEVLRRAQVVIYDQLVNPELLRLAPEDAELICAYDRKGAGGGAAQAELNRLLIERVLKGCRVVWLQCGDPFLFGRGGEAAQALARAAVPFEVVPGLSAAIAAPAFAGIPLTYRQQGALVALITGHGREAEGAERRIAWDALARAARTEGALVLLTVARPLEALAEGLMAAGLAGETPAAAIQGGTLASQKTVSAPLATLAEEAARLGVGAPCVVVIGPCARLREEVRWFEQLALFGRRIVVTRAFQRSSSLAAELREAGAEVIEFPTIATTPPASYEVLDRAIARLGSFDWVLFTSATGVQAFVARLCELGHDIRKLGRAQLGAIGPATAAALRGYGLRVAAMPRQYRAEAIFEAIGEREVNGKSFLIPRAEVAREALPELLRAQGAHEVVVAPAYRTVRPHNRQTARLRELIASDAIDLVCFTSSSTATNFCKIVGAPKPGLRAAAIGPITAETARKLGFDVVISAAEHTAAGLVAAIRDYFCPPKEGARR